MATTLGGRLEQVWQERVRERFERNYRGYWRSLGGYFALFLFAALCDAASTSYFLISQNASSDAEYHPVFRAQIASYGPVVGPLVATWAKALSAVIVTLYWRRQAIMILLAAAGVGFFGAWYNIWGIDHHAVSRIVGMITENSPWVTPPF